MFTFTVYKIPPQFVEHVHRERERETKLPQTYLKARTLLSQECPNDKRKLVYEDQFWLHHPPVKHLKTTCTSMPCVPHANQLCAPVQAVYDFQFGMYSVPAACAHSNILQDIWDDKLQ